jgi:VIT1/CCC1 family predicted Fe2+/Mn2+ transporter
MPPDLQNILIHLAFFISGALPILPVIIGSDTAGRNAILKMNK